MNDDRKEFFRALLHERLQALLVASSAALGSFTDVRTLEPDSVDQAAQESNREFALRLQDRERRLLHKIKHALRRLDDGEYGVCLGCGEDISERRLLARPVATHCIDCQTEAEQLERGVRVF